MKKPWIIAAGAGLVTGLLYLPILRNGFVTWDDGIYVFNNPWLRSLDLNLLRFAVGFQTPNWHPLTWIVHALEYAFWGLNPAGHHATSILLHTLNTVLLFFVVLKLLAARDRAFSPDTVARPAGDSSFHLTVAGATSLLFGIHPAHVESVAWASGKKDLLCTFFVLVTVYAYARYVRRERTNTGAGHRGMADAWYLASVGSFLLALLSKPSAVTFPLILLMLDVYPFERLQAGLGKVRLIIMEKIPFVMLSFAAAAITYYAHHILGDITSVGSVGITTRLLVSAKAAVFYLVHLLWPVGLLPLYPYPEKTGIMMPSYLFSVMALALISLSCAFLWKKRKLPMAIWLYFLISLIPVIGLVKMGFQEMADRYAYLPGIGPILLFAVGLSAMLRKTASTGGSPVRFAGIAAGGLLVLFLSLLTVRQAGIWKDDLTLWNYEIKTDPQLSWLAYQNRGVAYSKMERFDAALDDYIQALAMNPRSPELYYNRANIYARMGRFSEAAVDYATAISLAESPHPDYFHNRGIVYRKLGRQAEAEVDLREEERLRRTAVMQEGIMKTNSSESE